METSVVLLLVVIALVVQTVRLIREQNKNDELEAEVLKLKVDLSLKDAEIFKLKWNANGVVAGTRPSGSFSLVHDWANGTSFTTPTQFEDK